MSPLQSPQQRLHNRVRVAVRADSAEQVSLSGLERLPEMTLQAVKENGVELGSEVFLPRNCSLELEFRGWSGGDSGAVGSSTPHTVRGVVRRVRTATSAPSYTLWIRPDEREPDELDNWRGLQACVLETARQTEET